MVERIRPRRRLGLGGSLFLKREGITWAALILLLAPAFPAVLYLLFILAIIVLQLDWR